VLDRDDHRDAEYERDRNADDRCHRPLRARARNRIARGGCIDRAFGAREWMGGERGINGLMSVRVFVDGRGS
jgi:hypothetical protein